MSLLPNFMGSLESNARSLTSAGIDKALTKIDPKNARLAVAGLIPGGAGALGKVATNVIFGALGLGNPGVDKDWRVRVSLGDSANFFYNAADKGILAPLFKGSLNQNGVIFPYTPQIQTTHTARYAEQKLTHSNYANYFYEGSDVSAITISGDFTVQNETEGQYLLAAIYFFRSCTKMWFGENGGNPPPMVFLNGYGTHYFPNVPCVITSFQHTMPQDVDYIEVPLYNPSAAVVNSIIGAFGNSFFKNVTKNQNTTRLPTSSQVSITLQPIYSRKAVTRFNLDDFARGKLVGGSGGKGTGGFI